MRMLSLQLEVCACVVYYVYYVCTKPNTVRYHLITCRMKGFSCIWYSVIVMMMREKIIIPFCQVKMCCTNGQHFNMQPAFEAIKPINIARLDMARCLQTHIFVTFIDRNNTFFCTFYPFSSRLARFHEDWHSK